MTTLRLVLRQHRFVIVSVVLLAVAVAAAAILVARSLADVASPAHCILDRFQDPVPADCLTMETLLERNEAWAGKVMAAMAVLPLIAGVLIGVPLVGAEIEQRTATIAWSLGPSRRRWLVVRLAILGVGLAVLLALPAFAANVLETQRPPNYDPATATLVDYGLRGPVVVARGLAVFAIAVLCGLALGRQLPALIVAGLLAVLLWNGLGTLSETGWPAAHEFTPRDDQSYVQTGSAVGAQGATKEGPVAITGIPGEQLAFVEPREVAVLGALTLVLLGAAVVGVEWRRPV
jgi:hypothetical protein